MRQYQWFRALLLVCVFSTALAPRAAAMCMGPQTVISPGPGSTLPPNPSLYLFVPEPETAMPPVEILSDVPLPYTVTKLSKTASLTVYRLDVTVGAGQDIVVRVHNPERENYAVGADFIIGGSAAQTRAPLSLRSVDFEYSRWTCSYQQSRNVRLSSTAAAFRVEWAANEHWFRAGATTTLILPATMGRFHDPEDRSVPSEAVLELGHVNCFGNTLAWGDEKPLYVGITALYSDGSTQQLGGGPLELHPPKRPFVMKLMENYLIPLRYRVNRFVARGWSFW